MTEYQFGFRSGKGTSDCQFLLNAIIQTALNVEKKKLYCAFVDFRKAFDTVYRNGL